MLQVTADDIEMTVRLLTGLFAGALIGYERSYHGRPAGFRTHALVCMASSLLMLVTVYESHWVRAVTADSVRLDPTRMAQGIMTGIGFLGAGAILKEGLTIRGLTTAASIWMTSAIGIMAGIGFYFPLVVSVLLTLGVLSVFRRIESLMPTQSYYQFEVRFARQGVMTEEAIRALLAEHGFSIANLSHRVDGEGRVRRYGMVLRTHHKANASRLADTLEAMETVYEFRIAPTGD
ncbi:MAG TPA: MgtC/SapB family protein [Steroidobacteraceae bacterium]|nr:MgtC/SapB family protein [Steroidobacteraceae bacterium]